MGTDFSPELCGWILIGSLPFIWLFVWPFVATVWSGYVVYFVWNQFLHKKYIDPSGKAVFVTGCDTGFGHHVAIQLAREGFLVFAGCLNPIGHSATSLRDFGGENIKVLDLDVTDAQKVESCALEIERVVNELGMRGRVITISSGIARSSNPGRAVYCVSKYGIEAFMDCLRYEMAKFGVKAITIAPGNFTSVTNIFDGLDATLDRLYAGIDEKTRSDYGEQYLQAFRDKVSGRYRSQGGSIGVQAVVSAIKDAIMMESPRARYKPMQPGWILWSFVVELLPYDLTDKYVQFTERAMPRPKSS